MVRADDATATDATDTTATTIVDVDVLGMGPGGEDVAGQLASAGLSVVGIEAGLVGGECPYWGCVPSKMMIRAAHVLAEARRVPGLAGRSTVTPDWAPVAARIRAEATDNWDDTVAVDRFVGKGGTFVRGRGRLVSADAVEVDGHHYHATRAVVVATGTTAAVPPSPGLADTPYWTNHQAIETETLPGSIIVLGDAGIDVAVGRIEVPSTARGWLHKAGNEGFIQLVADRGRGVLVGATSMGPNGGEVLGLLTLAVHARIPIEELRSMIYAYPTFHRSIEDALRELA